MLLNSLCIRLGLISLFCTGAALGQSLSIQNPPAKPAPHDLNTTRQFPAIRSKGDWQKRARQIREQVLVSCGLWPLPEKTPLQAHISGRIDRDDYTIEKVYFQTYPGFYLAGNLYRPKGKGAGPFPGVLNPHGHWENGRMADNTNGSIAARCISFARQGMVAFSYDMVGYNDTIQIPKHREFATHPTNLLWNISLMGLQTWNSIRALDFLESLPDVDKNKLACTGESGGGTQTFMLGAIDDRLKVQAPVVMVSHSMQGGCLCENAPGLRVRFSNMEIAAAPAPRPQILVAATGDWTKDTGRVEGPAISRIYDLFGASNHFRHVTFNYGHNYNQTSREAVYQWFGQWLLNLPGETLLKENNYKKEPDAQLRIWPDGKLPADALPEKALIESLITSAQRRYQALVPRSENALAEYKARMKPAWEQTFQLDLEPEQFTATVNDEKKGNGYNQIDLTLYKPDNSKPIQLLNFLPTKGFPTTVIILASPNAQADFLGADGGPAGLAKTLVASGHAVLFQNPAAQESSRVEPLNSRTLFSNFYSTYNRTELQQRVGDLVTLCAFAKGIGKGPRVILLGEREAGLWCVLASPAADTVIADGAGIKSSDEFWLRPENFVPGIYRVGGPAGIALLSAPRPLLLHNLAASKLWEDLPPAYGAARLASLKTSSERISGTEMLAWLKTTETRR